MIPFNEEQIKELKAKRDARYKAMSEEDLRNQIDRFIRELRDKDMYHIEALFKTNSLKHNMMELNRRGLFVEPVIVATQKKKPETHTFITMEIDSKSIERNILKLLSGSPIENGVGKSFKH